MESRKVLFNPNYSFGADSLLSKTDKEQSTSEPIAVNFLFLNNDFFYLLQGIPFILLA